MCNNISGVTRVLLDNCSQPTLISEAFVRRYNIRVTNADESICVQGVGQTELNCQKMCRVVLVSRFSSFKIEIEALARAIRYNLHSASICNVFENLRHSVRRRCVHKYANKNTAS